MARQKRDFKGVWIPKEIWCSPQLSLMEKVLFTEINSLDNEDGCYAKNQYFAKFFSVSERQIRTYIGSLRNKGLIAVSIKDRFEQTIRLVGNHVRFADINLDDNRKRRDE